jgi:hypothetical protein
MDADPRRPILRAVVSTKLVVIQSSCGLQLQQGIRPSILCKSTTRNVETEVTGIRISVRARFPLRRAVQS